MEVYFSRYIKDLGALSPEELTSLFSKSKYTEEQKEEFLTMMKSLLDDGRQLNTPKHSRLGKSRPESAMRASKKDITRSVLIKMRQKLAVYEENDQINQMQIDFAIGVDYGQLTMDAIKERHNR